MKLIIKFRLKYPNTARQGASSQELRPSRMDHGEATSLRQPDGTRAVWDRGQGEELPQ